VWEVRHDLSPKTCIAQLLPFRHLQGRFVSLLANTWPAKIPKAVPFSLVYGVDPFLLMAIAKFETGSGTSYSARTRNNIAGIMNPRNPSQHMVYGSIEEGIEAQARILADRDEAVPSHRHGNVGFRPARTFTAE
jgi:mannosyl-glycoprotein endo-beta-N-acetylglucosaminidase